MSPEPMNEMDPKLAELVEQAVGRVREELLQKLQETRTEVESLRRLAAGEPSPEAPEPAPRVDEVGSLRGALSRLDAGESQADVLSALLEGGAEFASRAALFLTQSDSARGWASYGFGEFASTVAELTYDYDAPGGWEELAAGRGAVRLSGEACAAFCRRIDGSEPVDGVLIPFVLRDRVAAALYADRLSEERPLRVEALQILTYCAAQAVEGLPLRQRAATATLRFSEEAPEERGLPLWEAAAVAAPLVETEVEAEPEALEVEAEPEAAVEEAVEEAEETVDLEPVEEAGFEVELAEPSPEAAAPLEAPPPRIEVPEILEPAEPGVVEEPEMEAPPVEAPPVEEPPVEEPSIEPTPAEAEPFEEPAPEIAEPFAPEPVAPEPLTPEPVTPEPVTPEPVTPEPVTPEPVSAEPITPEPLTAEGVAVEPEAPKPAAEPPAAPARESTQIEPPPDVEGPGWAFTTTRISREATEEAVHEEARRLARLLVTEIKLYNEETVEEGRRHRDVYSRLKEDIDRSRQIFEERIDEQVRGASDYFQEELVRILGGGDPQTLGM